MSARASRRTAKALVDRKADYVKTVSSNSKRDGFNPKAYHEPGSLNPRHTHGKAEKKKRGR